MNSPTPITIKKHFAPANFAGFLLMFASLLLTFALSNSPAHVQASTDPSASTTPSPSDWTQFHRDNMQRWNPDETTLGVNSVGGLHVNWSFALGSGPVFKEELTSPTVANGVLYISSLNDVLFALNAGTGQQLWSRFSVGGSNSSAAVANGIVYVGSDTGNMYALNASTGATIWTFTTGPNSIVGSSPAVANGIVYVAAGDGNLYALNAGTGAKLWSIFRGDVPGNSASAAVANGVVYFAFSAAKQNVLGAVNAGTGAPLWTYDTGSAVLSSPAVANGVVYVGNEGGNVFALNASTGALLWKFFTGVITFSSPAVANGVVYIGTVNGTVFALNASTGSKLWSFTTGHQIDSSPAVANGVVYIGSEDGNIYALNASTGSKLFSFPTGKVVDSSPTVVDGVLYANSPDTVYAFGLGGAADLFLRVQPSPTPVVQGQLLTYAFPVWNLGPGTADLEVLTTQVPAGTTFDYLRISGTPGLGTCTHPPFGGTGTIVCHENGVMAPNTTWTVRLTVKVTAPSGTVITESGTVTEQTADPNPANNTAMVSNTVK